MIATLFLDTAYAIALASKNDRFNDQANRLADQVQLENIRLITTRPVVIEVGNSLAKRGLRSAAVTLLSALESDPRVEIVPLSEDLYKKAFDMYAKRTDKEWGVTDCISFVVMSERSLTAALSSDVHFEQAGFRALRRETPPVRT